MGLTFVYQVEHHAAFGSLIVLYFFLAGLSAGLFLLSSLSTVFGLEKFKAIAKPSAAMALATLIPGLLALVIDLGQPLRALTLFFRVNPSSVMSWGSFILLIYGVIALVYTYYLWEDDSHKVKVWGRAGVIFASALGLYTGFLLAVVPGRPLWNSALLPILFLVSGAVAALSLLSIAQSFFPKAGLLNEGAEEAMHSMKVGIVTLEILLLAFHLLAVAAPNQAGRAVVQNLLSGTKGFSFVVVQVVLGMLIPLLILFLSKRSVLILGISGLLSLIGVYALRYNFVFGGEELPQAGTLLYRFDGGSAWILIVGFLALTAILIYLIPRLFNACTDNKVMGSGKAV